MRERGRSGRTKEVALARLLGRLVSLGSRLETGPNDSLLIPEVDNLATCFVVDDGVSSPGPMEDPLAVLPAVRFRLRIVTLGGM